MSGYTLTNSYNKLTQSDHNILRALVIRYYTLSKELGLKSRDVTLSISSIISQHLSHVDYFEASQVAGDILNELRKV